MIHLFILGYKEGNKKIKENEGWNTSLVGEVRQEETRPGYQRSLMVYEDPEYPGLDCSILLEDDLLDDLVEVRGDETWYNQTDGGWWSRKYMVGSAEYESDSNSENMDISKLAEDFLKLAEDKIGVRNVGESTTGVEDTAKVEGRTETKEKRSF